MYSNLKKLSLWFYIDFYHFSHFSFSLQNCPEGVNWNSGFEIE